MLGNQNLGADVGHLTIAEMLVLLDDAQDYLSGQGLSIADLVYSRPGDCDPISHELGTTDDGQGSSRSK